MPSPSLTQAQLQAQSIESQEARNFSHRMGHFAMDRILARPQTNQNAGTFYLDDINSGLASARPGDGSTAADNFRYRIGPRGRKSSTWTYAASTFQTVGQGLSRFASDIDNDDYQNVRGHSLRDRNAGYLMLDLMTAYEDYLATIAFTAANWTGSGAPSTLWDAGGAMVEDVDEQSEVIRRGGGPVKSELSLVMGPVVRQKSRRNSAFLSDVSTNGGNSQSVRDVLGNNDIFERKLAEYLGIKQVVVGESTINTAKEGVDATRADIWGNFALLSWLRPGEDTEEAALIDWRSIDFSAGETATNDEAPNTRGANSWVDVRGVIQTPRPSYGYLFTAPITP